MAEGSIEKDNRGKHFEERHGRKFKHFKVQKRDHFLELLRQEGFLEDPFAYLSDEKLKEISDVIGRKREPRREITAEGLRLELKTYYYNIKLDEVKQEQKALKHKWRNERRNHRTLHEESPEASAENSPVVKNTFSAPKQDSADEGFEQVNYKDFEYNVGQFTDEYHPGENPQFGKGTAEVHAALNGYWIDQHQFQTKINIADQQKECTDPAHLKKEAETKSENSEMEARAIPGHEILLEGDREPVAIDQQVGRDDSGCPNGASPKQIGDINSEFDIMALTNRQLKEILSKNTIDSKGICERKDLLTLVQRLWEHNQEQEKDYSIASECVVCMNARINCAFLECGHMISCLQCGANLKECPMCRNYISRAVRIFRS